MKMIRAIFLFLTIALLSQYCAAQTDDLKRDQADYFYRHYAFSEAIPLYKSITNKTTGDNVKLADCYRLTNYPSNAAVYYSKAVAGTQELPAGTELHYGQVLMVLEKYADAEKWLEIYLQKSPSDTRAKNLVASCQTAGRRKAAMPGGNATFLKDLNTNNNEFAPTLWDNKLVFTSDSAYELKKKNDTWTGNSFFNLYSATFDSSRNIFGGEISTVPRTRKGNVKYHDGPCTFASEINEMYFTRTRCNRWTKSSKQNKDSVALLNIMVASHYDTTRRVFKKIKPFAHNSRHYSVAHPAVSPDGRMLIFASNKKGGAGGFDLYICKRRADGKWMPPENMGNLINTEGDELFPFLADEKKLFFSSDGQQDCFGGLDVYKSTFNGVSWSQPENSGTPVNSSYDDISLAMHDDGSKSFFSSNRPAKKRGDNIYFFQSKQLFILIDVKDAVTKKPLPGATITLAGAIDTFTGSSDVMGGYSNRLFPKFPYKYKIITALDGYTTAIDSSVFYGSNKWQDTIYIPIALERAGTATGQGTIVQTLRDTIYRTIVQTIRDTIYIPIERVQEPRGRRPVTQTIQDTPPTIQVDGKNEAGGAKKIFLNLKITDCRTRKPVRDTNVKVNVTFDTTIKRMSYYHATEVVDGELIRELYPGKKYLLEVCSFDYKTLYITKINTDFLANLHADTVIFDSVCLNAREDVIDLGLIPIDFDSSNLNSVAQTRLSKFVKYLNELHPTMKLLIRGHTDCRENTPGHNKILSERRAKVVMDFLILKGVAAHRLRAVGVGDNIPRVRCNNCEHDDSKEMLIRKHYKNGRTDCGANEHAENRYIDCVIMNF